MFAVQRVGVPVDQAAALWKIHPGTAARWAAGKRTWRPKYWTA